MYRCMDCKKEFEDVKIECEIHPVSPIEPQEDFSCPYCGSQNVALSSHRHCRCCGARLPDDKRIYCDGECKKRGEQLWKKQLYLKRRLLACPINKMTAFIEKYNKEHKTSYSYGQFVALVMPGLGRKQREMFI